MVSAITGNAGNIRSLSKEELLLMNLKNKMPVRQADAPPTLEKETPSNLKVERADEFVKEAQMVRSSLEAPKIEKMGTVQDEFIKSSVAAPATDGDQDKYKISYKKGSENAAADETEKPSTKPVEEKVKPGEEKKVSDKADKEADKVKDDEKDGKKKEKKIIGWHVIGNKICEPPECPPDCKIPSHHVITSKWPEYGYE